MLQYFTHPFFPQNDKNSIFPLRSVQCTRSILHRQIQLLNHDWWLFDWLNFLLDCELWEEPGQSCLMLHFLTQCLACARCLISESVKWSRNRRWREGSRLGCEHSVDWRRCVLESMRYSLEKRDSWSQKMEFRFYCMCGKEFNGHYVYIYSFIPSNTIYQSSSLCKIPCKIVRYK